MSKRVTIAVILIIAACLGACSKKEPAHDFSVSYERSSLNFPSEGGQLYVNLKWSACKILVSTDADFLQPSPLNVGILEGEGSTDITFVLAPTKEYSPRQAKIIFTLTDPESFAFTKELVITQDGLPVLQNTVKVDDGATYQSWDGFGAMNLGTDWKRTTDWSESEADVLLGDMGISIMRIRIPYDDSRWRALADECSYAYRKYGTRILATPWSMPKDMKTPQQTEAKKDGVTSSLMPECYERYALYLERFATFMKDHGAPLAAISVQNEPDYAATYDGCVWSAAQHLSFIRDYGHLIKSADLVTGESMNFRQSFYQPVLQDAKACGNIDIVGGHLYGAVPVTFSLAAEKGKRIWMTEHLLNDSWEDGTEPWEETLQMLSEIHGCITSGWNAYIWWYGCRYYSLVGDGDGGTVRGKILQRGYAYSQYSKFIRPGDVRLGVTVLSPDNLLACAFKGEDGCKVVLVNTGKALQEITLAGVSSAHASATYTSREANVADLPLEVSGSSVLKFSIPGESVATVVY